METTAPRFTEQTPLTVQAAAAEAVSELIDMAAGIDRTIAGLMALRAQVVEKATAWNESAAPEGLSKEMQFRSFRAELACALRIPERTAENLMATSRSLISDLPDTLTALLGGRISYRHAQVMVDNTLLLEPEVRAGIERAALPYAERLTVSKFERKVRTLRERSAPEAMAERHERAILNREVQLSAERDGMAWLSALLPAVDAVAGFNRLTQIAKALKHPAEERTITQLRADVFRDLLLDGEPALEGPTGIRPRVYVTVPVMALLGLSEEPASLDGYGPIDPDTARRLCANAPGFYRLLTHPETGVTLSLGRDSYRIPKKLRRWLALRDKTCRAPGCNQPATLCDIDHTIGWADDGSSDHDNLAYLCRGHHVLKSETDWNIVNSRDETLTWTSPLGKTYTTEPEIRMHA